EVVVGDEMPVGSAEGAAPVDGPAEGGRSVTDAILQAFVERERGRTGGRASSPRSTKAGWRGIAADARGDPRDPLRRTTLVRAGARPAGSIACRPWIEAEFSTKEPRRRVAQRSV